MLDSDGCQGLKCPGNPITRQHIISQDGPKGFQKFPGGLNRLSWVTAVAPTVKTIPPKPCPGISEIGVFRNCPDPEMLVSPEPSSKSQVSRVKHFPWDVGGTPFLGTLGVRPSLGRWGYALPAFVPKVGSDKPCSNHYCGNHQPCQGQADCPDVPLLSPCKSAFGYALGEFGCAI